MSRAAVFIALWILHVLWTSLWRCQQQHSNNNKTQQQQQVIISGTINVRCVKGYIFSAGTSKFFLEEVSIPESNHDTVTPIVSDSESRDRIRDTGKHNKPRHKSRVKSPRKPQRTFEFSNELLDRYVRPKKNNVENFSERGRGLMDQV